MARRPRGNEPPASLGSFSQPSDPLVPGTEVCSNCGDPKVTRIRMRTPSGRAAVFVSCSRCETTAWIAVDGDGRPMRADEVGGLG